MMVDASKGSESDADWDRAAELVVEIQREARAERLRLAINHAGGPAQVARRIPMPIATLNNYLGGRDMKASAMVALAKACDVSIRWLASGDGEMQEGTAADIGAIIPRFGDSISKPANFWALLVLLYNCQEYHRQVKITPTLAEVLEWIGPLYTKARELPDRRITLQGDEENAA